MLTPEQQLRARQRRKDAKHRKALTLKWKSGKSGGTGRKRLGPVIDDPRLIHQLGCMSCGTSIGILDSVPGKMVTTFHQMDKAGARFYVTPKRDLLKVDLVDRQMIPHLQEGRVCRACVPELTEILSDAFERAQPVYAEGSNLGFGHDEGRTYTRGATLRPDR